MEATSPGSDSAVRSDPQLWLRLEGLPRSQWGYPFKTEAQTIGRSPGCHIRIGDRTISREHAVVWLKEGVPYIRDLDSINGTRVNGKRIRTCVLVSGDLIEMGQITLRAVPATEKDGTPDKSRPASNEPQAVVVNASASAAGQYTPTNLEETKLREDLAAIYSLGGTLALCTGRSEALHQLFDWMRDWLGVEQAAAVFRVHEQLKVTARNWQAGPPSPDRIHWPAVKASLEQQQLVAKQLFRAHVSSSTEQPSDEPIRVLATWIPAAVPPGVIYGEWGKNSGVWEKRCSELFNAAAKVLADALARLGGERLQSSGDPGATWMQNVQSDLLVGGAAMQRVSEFIRRAAAIDATVLVTGETGTGKELVSRAIHMRSTRVKGEFIARNCSAFAESLLEDELFGHEPGAFTGATKLRKGLFDQANHGTLLLDEIADTTPALQAKLLRVLEEQTFQRVGGSQSVQVDARIIAATNRDLQQAVEAGQFRRDLFYRLEVLTIHLPPLRDRIEDVQALAEHFVDLACKRWNLPRLPLSLEAVHKLRSHVWPGNIRELRNSIERAIVLSQGTGRIDAEHVLLAQTSASSAGNTTRLDDIQYQHILQVLAQVGGNKAKAAVLLGIDRSTLLRKLHRYSAGKADSK